MKRVRALKYTAVFAALFFSGCNGDNVPDCFQNAGDLVQEEVTLPGFEKITVFEGVQLVVRSGSQQQVIIETGEYLREEVSAVVEGNTLILRNTNNCNLFREYGITKVFVASPNINEIRSSTGWPVRSEGTLNFPNLTLITESFNNPETETTDGSFDMTVDVQNLQLVANGIAYFKLAGNAERFNTTIAAGDSRIEAEALLADEVIVNHRGSNDILVNPQQILRGVIRGTGDVISFNRPDSVSVEVLFRGKLIYND
ncbi:head GIN domain-containing protein [Muriicola sp. E247]|uniref:head GIN domain-containing protein n=1 Tax=Muriicola sp. E247 TaxID=3242730 RepID=UPI0035233D5D